GWAWRWVMVRSVGAVTGVVRAGDVTPRRRSLGPAAGPVWGGAAGVAGAHHRGGPGRAALIRPVRSSAAGDPGEEPRAGSPKPWPTVGRQATGAGRKHHRGN